LAPSLHTGFTLGTAPGGQLKYRLAFGVPGFAPDPDLIQAAPAP
jgi:hypothetical protein